MARLIRLSEAVAAVSTLDEALSNASLSEIERDSAILRLIYSYEAAWKACQQLLRESEDIEESSPNEVARAARRLGWLSAGVLAEGASNKGGCVTVREGAKRDNDFHRIMPP